MSLERVKVGEERHSFISALGAPKSTSKDTESNTKTDIFEFVDGFSGASKSRAILYIAGDVFSLGLAEIIFWPIEELAVGQGTQGRAIVTYGMDDLAQSVLLTKADGSPWNINQQQNTRPANFTPIEVTKKATAPVTKKQPISDQLVNKYPDSNIDIENNIPEGKKAGKYDIAVIIGNKNYLSTSAVDYAIRDARAMKDYVIKVMGFDPANVIYAEDAGFSKFNEFFGNLSDPSGKSKLRNYVRDNESNVLVYYVGHGAPDIKTGDAYFIPVDSDPMFIESSGYRLQTLYDKLSDLPIKKATVILDSCFSGNSPKGLIFSKISGLMVREKMPVVTDNKLTVITSTSPQQVSSWYDEKKHSLFTYYLLKGFQGEADTNGDGKITVREIRKYLSENVVYIARRTTNTDQNPQVIGNDDDILVTLR